ncbi:F-box associated domain containing protein [Tanacetum coccineum]
MAAIIPEDIITTHILRRLPSKSIGQFRCVSKRWLSLLTDPQFIQTHQKTLDTNRFIFEESNDDDGSLPTTLNNKRRIIIFGESASKDGSLCSVPYNNNHEEALMSTTITLDDLHHLYINGSVNGLVLASAYKDLHYKDYTLAVLNPTTKHYVALPSSLHKQFFGMKGFGYDSVSGDYKVVVFCRTSYGLLFVLTIEKLTELPPPSQVDLSDIDTKLVSLGDKLAIFHQVKGDIWVMNEYGVHKSWTKILVNGFDQIPLYKPIVFNDNGKKSCFYQASFVDIVLKLCPDTTNKQFLDLLGCLFELLVKGDWVASVKLWDDTRHLTPLEIDQMAYMILNEFYRAVVTPLDTTAPQ